MCENIGATSLASVTFALDSNKVLVDWPLLAIVQVLGLANFEVFLSLASPVGSRFLLLDLLVVENAFLFFLPFLFELLGLIFGQRVNHVGSLAVSKDGLFTGGEVSHLGVSLNWGWNAVALSLKSIFKGNVIGLDLISASSTDVKLDLGQEGPLDVRHENGFVPVNEELLDQTALVVDSEGGLQVLPDVLRNWGLLGAVLSLGSLLQPLLIRKVDLSIDSPEFAVLKLHPERVISKGLDSGNSREPHSGDLGTVDLRNASENLGLKPVDQLAVRCPSVVVSRVAKSHSNKDQNSKK